MAKVDSVCILCAQKQVPFMYLEPKGLQELNIYQRCLSILPNQGFLFEKLPARLLRESQSTTHLIGLCWRLGDFWSCHNIDIEDLYLPSEHFQCTNSVSTREAFGLGSLPGASNPLGVPTVLHPTNP